MADSKFILDDSSTITIGGDAITCFTEIEFDESADTFFAQCAGASGAPKEPVVGMSQITGTITAELKDDDVTMAGYLAVGASGALVCYPRGNVLTYLKIASTALTISGRQIRLSSGGLATISAPFVMKDLTLSAATGA